MGGDLDGGSGLAQAMDVMLRNLHVGHVWSEWGEGDGDDEDAEELDAISRGSPPYDACSCGTFSPYSLHSNVGVEQPRAVVTLDGPVLSQGLTGDIVATPCRIPPEDTEPGFPQNLHQSHRVEAMIDVQQLMQALLEPGVTFEQQEPVLGIHDFASGAVTPAAKILIPVSPAPSPAPSPEPQCVDGSADVPSIIRLPCTSNPEASSFESRPSTPAAWLQGLGQNMYADVGAVESNPIFWPKSEFNLPKSTRDGETIPDSEAAAGALETSRSSSLVCLPLQVGQGPFTQTHCDDPNGLLTGTFGSVGGMVSPTPSDRSLTFCSLAEEQVSKCLGVVSPEARGDRPSAPDALQVLDQEVDAHSVSTHICCIRDPAGSQPAAARSPDSPSRVLGSGSTTPVVKWAVGVHSAEAGAVGSTAMVPSPSSPEVPSGLRASLHAESPPEPPHRPMSWWPAPAPLGHPPCGMEFDTPASRRSPEVLMHDESSSRSPSARWTMTPELAGQESSVASNCSTARWATNVHGHGAFDDSAGFEWRGPGSPNELGDVAPPTLLGGTLYAYGDAAPRPAFSPVGVESNCSFEGFSRPITPASIRPMAPALQELLESSLEQLLRAGSREGSGSLSRSSWNCARPATGSLVDDRAHTPWSHNTAGPGSKVTRPDSSISPSNTLQGRMGWGAIAARSVSGSPQESRPRSRGFSARSRPNPRSRAVSALATRGLSAQPVVTSGVQIPSIGIVPNSLEQYYASIQPSPASFEVTPDVSGGTDLQVSRPTTNSSNFRPLAPDVDDQFPPPPEDDDTMLSVVGVNNGRVTPHGILQHFAEFDDTENLIGVASASSPPPQPAAEADYRPYSRSLSAEGSSVWGLGDTMMSSSDSHIHSEQQSARTLLGGETTGSEAVVDTSTGLLAPFFQRIVFDAGPFDEGIARSLRRMLQLSSALAGERLTDEEIRNLPKVRFQGDDQQRCSICLEQYQTGELLTALSCSHFFHVDCLAGWFHHSTQCPLCRSHTD